MNGWTPITPWQALTPRQRDKIRALRARVAEFHFPDQCALSVDGCDAPDYYCVCGYEEAEGELIELVQAWNLPEWMIDQTEAHIWIRS